MAAKKKSTAMDFIVGQLKRNPRIEYAALAKAAAKKRLKIYPIMYGRALKLLGMEAPHRKPRRRAAAAGARRAAGGRAGNNGNTADALQQLASTLRNEHQEHVKLRQTLIKIRDLIDGVL